MRAGGNGIAGTSGDAGNVGGAGSGGSSGDGGGGGAGTGVAGSAGERRQRQRRRRHGGAAGAAAGRGGATGGAGATAAAAAPARGAARRTWRHARGTGAGGGTGGQLATCVGSAYDAASPPQPLTLTGSLGAHDPAALVVGNTIYLFATGLIAKTSTNLTTWQNAPNPLNPRPAWVAQNVPGATNLWAPDISYFGGDVPPLLRGLDVRQQQVVHRPRDEGATSTAAAGPIRGR